MAKWEVVREYAGRIEYLDTFEVEIANIAEVVALAIAKGGYVQVWDNEWPEDTPPKIVFEAVGRTHFYDDIGDYPRWEED